MKKITLIVASTILVGSMALAAENPVFLGNEKNPHHYTDYRNAEPIRFIERGIEFYVFPDGEFDFSTRPSGPRSSTINTTYGAPGVSNSYYGPSNYGVRIEHDNFGRVRRVGNVFINYDRYNRVKRVGSVYMKYNSFALSQIGGMRILYNRRGFIIDTIGFVNGYNHGYIYHPYSNNPYPTQNDFEYEYNDNGSEPGYNENDYYYFKSDGTKAKMSAEDIETVKKDETTLRLKTNRN